MSYGCHWNKLASSPPQQQNNNRKGNYDEALCIFVVFGACQPASCRGGGGGELAMLSWLGTAPGVPTKNSLRDTFTGQNKDFTRG